MGSILFPVMRDVTRSKAWWCSSNSVATPENNTYCNIKKTHKKTWGIYSKTGIPLQYVQNNSIHVLSSPAVSVRPFQSPFRSFFVFPWDGKTQMLAHIRLKSCWSICTREPTASISAASTIFATAQKGRNALVVFPASFHSAWKSYYLKLPYDAEIFLPRWYH